MSSVDTHNASLALRPRRIPLLQALRGVASILIIIKHALYELTQTTPLQIDLYRVNYLTVGIDIFFVLSGFIMVYTTRGQSGWADVKRFALKRIIRIVPIYWVYTLLLLGVALAVPQVLAKAEFMPLDFIKSLFFIPYINSAGDLRPFLANGWTLNYEMYFYGVFALSMFLPSRWSLVAVCAFFTLSVATGFFGIGGLIGEFYGRPIILEFIIGAMIGWCFVNGYRLPAWSMYAGYAFGVAALLIILILPDLNDVFEIRPFKAVVGCVLIALLALPRGSENFALPKPLILSGDASYTLYLSHPFGIGVVTQLMMVLGLSVVLNPWIIFALTCAVCIAGGIAAYFLMERPLLTWIKRVSLRS